MATALLLMAMTYANNLVYLYTFSLISVALMSMALTNENVRRLKAGRPQVTEAFALEPAWLSLELENPSRNDSRDFKLRVGRQKENSERFELEARRSTLLRTPWTPERRGWIGLPSVTLSSDFPFGLLWAWKWTESGGEILVYPEKKGVWDFPAAADLSSSTDRLGLFRDHRLYQSTDSPRRIDWRATARVGDLLVKNFDSDEGVTLAFDWAQTSHLPDVEARLSQLTLWICRAEDTGGRYSLRLPGFESGLSSGPTHRRRCLEALAVFDSPPQEERR